jgi:CheY-like chemotaxis protein
LSQVRLVALTGYGRSEDRLHALAAGFDDHLVKPVELPALDRALTGPPVADSVENQAYDISIRPVATISPTPQA